jgi:signal transduction histidine kinase
MVVNVSDVRQLTPGAIELRPPLFRRITVRQYRWLDIALATFLLLCSIPVWYSYDRGGPASKVLLGLCVFGASVPIAFRRRAPILALVLITLSVAGGFALGTASLSTVDPAFPMFQVAVTYDRKTSLQWLIGVAIVFTAAVGVAAAAARPHPLGSGLVVVIAAWFVGDSARVRRAYTAGLTEQAAQRSREELERAERSVAEEKLRIARDLHDVIAHTLSVVAVQSGVGRHVIDTQPEDAKRALEAIEETSRAALGELRRMLNVLRSDDTTADLAPAPGLGDLELLAGHVTDAGVPVTVTRDLGDLGALPASMELSVYRIVQEALTNVVKHAGQARATVDIRCDRDALLVTIQDDGAGDDSPTVTETPGHGIIGMRERASALDGTLIAEALPGRGFCVRARLPLQSSR